MPHAYLNECGSLVKRCTKCGALKPADDFFKRSAAHSKDGYNSQCKQCAVDAKWVSVTKNKTHYAMQSKEYYERNKTEISVKNKERRKKDFGTPQDRHRLHKYGLSLSDYENMLKIQEEKCYICNTHKDQCRGGVLCVDHNHETLVVRKLLCHTCNTAIGLAKDNIMLLSKMVKYLKEHNGDA